MPDLAGKVHSGVMSIGFNIANQLALRGAKVYIGARSADKAQAAIDTIISTSPTVPKHNLKMFIADLGDLEQVKEASEKFLANEILDSHGISLSIVTNHIAPFSTATYSDVRVVMQDDLMANRLRYGHSKLASTLFASELQRRLNEEGSRILVISVIRAQFTGRLDGAMTPLEGANTALFAATAAEVSLESSKYAEPSQDARNPVLAAELWSTTETAVADIFSKETQTAW
ncbi:hypothetical protein BDQ17DRAFT_1366320 [Cyathus striatus]|nr:hypothetical protein BDQ17DRAFT_1366320 [Cyathus striatus]